MLADHQKNALAESACRLAAEVVGTFGEVRLRVFGTSMVPSILPGDVVSVRQASLQDLSPGEIAVFLRHGRLFIHRVVHRNAEAIAGDLEAAHLITRGDRLLHDDPPVTSSELLGRVGTVERGNRKVELLAQGSNHLIARLLRASDRATYLYLRLVACAQTLLFRRTKCQL
jgi:Peptidase S24-like